MTRGLTRLAAAFGIVVLIGGLPHGHHSVAWAIDSDDEVSDNEAEAGSFAGDNDDNDNNDDDDDDRSGKLKATEDEAAEIERRMLEAGMLAKARRAEARARAAQRPAEPEDFGQATVDNQIASTSARASTSEPNNAAPAAEFTDHQNRIAETNVRFDAAAQILKGFLESQRGRRSEALSLLQSMARSPLGDVADVNGIPGDLSASVIAFATGSRGFTDLESFRSAADYGNLAAVKEFSEGLAARSKKIADLISAVAGMKSALADSDNNSQAAVLKLLGRFLQAAGAHLKAVNDAISATIRNYPNALGARHNLELGDTEGLEFGSGRNATTFKANFDFAQGRGARPAGDAFNALFKAEPAPGSALAAADEFQNLGVDTSGKAPMRLSQRAKATAVVAKLLDQEDMVVATELATVNGSQFGIVMEMASGRAPVKTDWIPARDTAGDRDLINGHVAVSAQLATAQANYNGALQAVAAEQDQRVSAAPSGRARTFTIAPKPALESAEARLSGASKAINNERRNFAHISERIRPSQAIGPNGAPQAGWEVSAETRWLSDADLARPELRRALAIAELLDHVCGQVDRHMANLSIDSTPNQPITVKLFDNDQSFAPDDYYGTDRLAEDTVPAAPNLANPPKVVDLAFLKALRTLTPDGLKRSLAGYLSAAELENLGKRLVQLQSYLETLPTVSLDGEGADFSWSEADPAVLFHNTDPKVDDRSRRSYYGEILHRQFVAGSAQPEPDM